MKFPDRIEAIYYGALAKNPEEVRTSSSGGVASVLARRIVNGGGCVFGAAYAPFPTVKHICVDSDSGIARLKGSKYVESDIKLSLKEVAAKLAKGKRVLFIGLPCQIAALYGVLGGDQEGLVTVDLICHGKPPQRLFLTWIDELQRRLGNKIVDYWFRNKFKCSWNDPDTFVHYCKLEDGQMLKIPKEWNWYARYFLSNASFMEGCYRCPFARLPRIADITIGDFWGAEKARELLPFVDKGISLVSVQSEKGSKLFEDIRNEVECSPAEAEFALASNRQLTHASVRPIYRNFVFKYVYKPAVVRKICDRILFGAGSVLRKLIPRKRI